MPNVCHVLCPGNEGNKAGSGMVILQLINSGSERSSNVAKITEVVVIIASVY